MRITDYRLSFLAAAAALATAAALAWLGQGPIWTTAVAAAGIGLAFVLRRTPESLPSAPPAEAPPPQAKTNGQAGSEALDSELGKALLLTGELAAAHEIQMRLVPHTFPPIRGCPPFDLYAMLEPAREIGGDFYDYWMLGKERLALVVADVSGKGVPAALYMAMTRTYLRAFSRYIHDPAELLNRLNNEVAQHNPGSMFVTVFCSVIDMTTGVLEYANAGHCPPLRRKRGDKVDCFPIADNPPAGFIPGLKFIKGETTLSPGEMLLLYTDGVTEGMNPDNIMFGESRVEEIFNDAVDMSDTCRAVTMYIQSKLADFVSDRDQYDDITIMAYRHPDDSDWDLDTGGDEDEAGGDSALASFGSITASLSEREPDKLKFFSLSELK